MRYTTSAAAALLVSLGAFAPAARAHHDGAEFVQDCYRTYLGRPADYHGLHAWVYQLRLGATPNQVRAGILGSEEYYELHGCTPEGFVAGLYADVLGRPASRPEVYNWVAHYYRVGCRDRVARDFLCAAKFELGLAAAPAVVLPPPVTPVRVVAPVAPTYVRVQSRYVGR